jgi:hypothetical protein
MLPANTDETTLSRRRLLQAGAVAGGSLWAMPVVDSFAARAAASSAPGGTCTATACICNGFNWNSTRIAGSSYIWFSALVTAISNPPSLPYFFQFVDQVVTFPKDGSAPAFSVALPDISIAVTGTGSSASLSFTPPASGPLSGGSWSLSTGNNSGNIFAGGLLVPVSSLFTGAGTSGLPGSETPTWCGKFLLPSTKMSLEWQVQAAVYTSSVPSADVSDPNKLQVQATDKSGTKGAGTPVAIAAYVTGGAKGGGGSNWCGSHSATGSAQCPCTR